MMREVIFDYGGGEVREFDLINRIKPAYYKNASLIKGMGDDGAVIQPSIGYEIVIASDTMVENVHFSYDYMSFEDIGYRVLAVNLSDLAAMGADPLYYAVNLAVPSKLTEENLIQLYNGMTGLANQYQMDLIGGDTVTANELVITVSVYGSVLPERRRLRSYAKPGDVVFVTGNLGEAAFGFDRLNDNYSLSDYFATRHKRPVPRNRFTEMTNQITRMALNDISDGLASELNELAESSNVNIEVNWEQLPVHQQMKNIHYDRLKTYVLSSGEDFELVGACSPVEWKKLVDLCADEIQLTQIGKVTESTTSPSVFLQENDRKTILKKSGYSHG